MPKRLLLLSVLTLLLSSCSTNYDFQVDNIYYNVSGTEATVTYKSSSYNSYSGLVAIPDKVTYKGVTYDVVSIGDYAFSDCEKLIEVRIPESVTQIGFWAFQNCTNLMDINIPSGVTKIGHYTFYNCSRLMDVVIPEGVNEIIANAFTSCKGLTWVTIPNSVEKIGGEAFANCPSLTEIKSKNPTPPSIDSSSFSGVSKSNCVLDVPTGSKEVYSQTRYWGEFSHINEVDF